MPAAHQRCGHGEGIVKISAAPINHSTAAPGFQAVRPAAKVQGALGVVAARDAAAELAGPAGSPGPDAPGD